MAQNLIEVLYYKINLKLIDMKTANIKFLIVCLIFITGTTGAYNVVCAQDNLTKKEKKELERAMLTTNFYAQDTILNLREFVLEADYLQGRRGELFPVSSEINFVKVQDNRGTLQTGNRLYAGGNIRPVSYNGLGGETTEGNITNYKITGNVRSLTHTVSFELVSPLGIFNIVMHIMADNTANATITSTRRTTYLTWRGNLVALFNTRVFKGEDTYRR